MTGQRILIIEDDLDFAGQLKTLMESRGFSVAVALTGGEGIRNFRELAADLILLDVKLPNIHGLRVAADIRSLPSGGDVPIFLMSAVYRRPDLFEGDMRRLGIETYLSKPFSFEELVRLVIEQMERPDRGRNSVQEKVEVGTASDRHAYARSDSSPRPLPAALAGGEGGMPGGVGEDTMLRADSARRLPRSGRLTPQTCVRILTTVFHSHSCGRLLRQVGKKHRTIYLLNGYPVWAEGPSPEEGVLRFLRVEGVLDSESAARVAADLRGDGGRLRPLLLATGRVDGDELDGLLEDWVAEEVRNTLRYDGDFEFTRSDDFAGRIPVYEINPIATLWEGLEASVDKAAIRQEMGELTDRSIGRTRSFSKLFGYVGAAPNLRAVGDYLEQPRSLRQIRSKFAEGSSVNLCLWFLLHAGLVAVSDSPRPGASRPARRKPAPPSAPAASAEPRSSGPAKSASAPPRAASEEDLEVHFEVRGISPARARTRDLTAALDAESTNPIELIELHHAQRLELDHYSFLGLPSDVSLEEIDAAYQVLAPRYRLRNLGVEVPADIRPKARALLAKLVNAFSELSDPARRRAYDSLVDRELQSSARSVPRPVPAVEAAPAEEAKAEAGAAADEAASEAQKVAADLPRIDLSDWTPGADEPDDMRKRCSRLDEVDAANLREAREAMKAGAFETAFGLLDALRERYPSDVLLLADIGWSRFGTNPDDLRTVDKAIEWVDLGLAFEPSNRRALSVKTRILCYCAREPEAHACLRRLAPLLPDAEWVRAELARRNESADEITRNKGLRRFWGARK